MNKTTLTLCATLILFLQTAPAQAAKRRPAAEPAPNPNSATSDNPIIADDYDPYAEAPAPSPTTTPTPAPVDATKTSTYSQQKQSFINDLKNKFFIYKPVYIIAGKSDLKLNLSVMYNFGESFNLNLGFTQTMFWNIYEKSQPMKDVNYNPEIFYRFKKGDQYKIMSYDLGLKHNSNGLVGRTSRSVDRVYLKTNFQYNYNRHAIKGDFSLLYTYGADPTNLDIDDYLGYWDLNLRYTNLFIFTKARTDLEFRIFAGSKVINVSRGGRLVGLVHHMNSKTFHPSLYLQYYSGRAETLIDYQKDTNELRFGLMLAM